MRARWLARILLPIMQRWADRRGHDLAIRDNTPENRIYLLRWHVLPRSDGWRPSLYLHNMLGDDHATLHDHPYWSLSIALTDGLIEYYVEDPDRYDQERTEGELIDMRSVARIRKIQQGQIVFRSSRFAHQLVVGEGEAWTLFLTGPRLSDWGFWCPRGWKPWRAFHEERVATITYNPSSYGNTKMEIGCGED